MSSRDLTGPGAVLGLLTAVGAFATLLMGVNYRNNFTATLEPPLVALFSVLSVGTLAVLVGIWHERRERGLQIPPDAPGSEDGYVAFPMPAPWLPWGALGLFTAAMAWLLGQFSLWQVGLAWTGTALLGGLVTAVFRRRRLYVPWKPEAPERLNRRTVRVARHLLELREGGLTVAVSMPAGRLPATVVAVAPNLREHRWPVDSVGDGELAIRMAGLRPTPPYAFAGAVGTLRKARDRPPAPRVDGAGDGGAAGEGGSGGSGDARTVRVPAGSR